MAIKRIARMPQAAKVASGSAAGIGVDAANARLYINRGEPSGDREPIPCNKFAAKVASFTLTDADDGMTFSVSSTSSIIATLPAATADRTGLQFTMVVKTVPSSGGHAFSPNSVDKIISASKADDADLVNTQATAAVGDSVTLVCDGLDGWYITSKIGTWA